MINKRGGRKRELSIYSILTIIVLISISGGRETRGETKVINPSDDAALLITEDFLNEREITTEQFIISGTMHTRIKEDKRQGKPNSTRVKHPHSGTYLTAIIVDNVRHNVTPEGDDRKDDGEFKDGWMAIKPGTHVIDVELSIADVLVLKHNELSGVNPKLQGSVPHALINIEPNSVYLLSVGLATYTIYTAGQMHEEKTFYDIERLSNTYNHNLGVVTDPTNSKFSFRIK